jgi:hypothetical protein
MSDDKQCACGGGPAKDCDKHLCRCGEYTVSQDGERLCCVRKQRDESAATIAQLRRELEEARDVNGKLAKMSMERHKRVGELEAERDQLRAETKEAAGMVGDMEIDPSGTIVEVMARVRQVLLHMTDVAHNERAEVERLTKERDEAWNQREYWKRMAEPKTLDDLRRKLYEAGVALEQVRSFATIKRSIVDIVRVKDIASAALASLEAAQPATHGWERREGYAYDTCSKCGVVRRADDKNNPCRGEMPAITTRDAQPAKDGESNG